MKKIFFIFLSCFLIFGCHENNGDVKKESLEKEVTQEKRIKFSDISSDKYKDKGKEIFEEVLKKDNITPEIFNNMIDEIVQKVSVETDEFNKEIKIIPNDEEITDKIKIEIYRYNYTDDDYINDYYVRGNITFTCINDDYFSFDKIIILTDRNRYEITGNVFAQNQERINGKSFHTIKYEIDADKLGMIYDMAFSDTIKIRFTKNDNNLDFEISDGEKSRIKTMADLFYTSYELKLFFEEMNKKL
jgi:lipoprotein|nr:MAG TPA: lipoprotein [Caudoviricetes sp.]